MRRSTTGTSARNPARSRRMRIKVPKPSRTFLEMDELVALTDAAGEQDGRFARPTLAVEPRRGSTAAKVGERWTPACGRATSPRSSASRRRRSPTTCAVCRLRARRPTSVAERSSRRSAAQRRARQRAVRHAHPRPAPARGQRSALPHPRREDRCGRARGAGKPRSPRGDRRARRPAAGAPTGRRPRRLSLPERTRRPHGPAASDAIVREAAALASSRLAARGLPRAAEHHAAHAAPHVHLGRAAGQPVRRALGDAPGRPRGLEDDHGRLRAAAAARRAPAWRGVRRARAARACAFTARPSARRLRGPADPAPAAHDV